MNVTSEQLDDDRAVIRVDGRIDLVSSANLREVVRATVGGGRHNVVVDVTGVEFIDSSGIGALIGGLREARQAGGELRIAGAGEQVRTVLELTRVDRVLKPYATVDEALEGL